MSDLRTDAISPMELLSLMERGARLTCELLLTPRAGKNCPEHWTHWELDGHPVPHAPGRCLLESGEIYVAVISEGLVIYAVV